MALLYPHRVVLVLAIATACVYAQKHAASIASMSISEIEDKLQVSIGQFLPLDSANRLRNALLSKISIPTSLLLLRKLRPSHPASSLSSSQVLQP